MVEHVVTHDGWMDGWRKHEGAFFSTKVTIIIAERTSVGS